MICVSWESRFALTSGLLFNDGRLLLDENETHCFSSANPSHYLVLLYTFCRRSCDLTFWVVFERADRVPHVPTLFAGGAAGTRVVGALVGLTSFAPPSLGGVHHIYVCGWILCVTLSVCSVTGDVFGR